jgi:DNA-binding transcriptional MerR regulator
MGFSSGEIRTLPAATAFEDPPATQTPEQRLAAFRQRMAALQAELQRAEENLRSVRAAANSNATIPPDRVLAVNAPGVTTQDQIRLLEQKRDDVRRRIEALEEEARRAGISSGQLR